MTILLCDRCGRDYHPVDDADTCCPWCAVAATHTKKKRRSPVMRHRACRQCRRVWATNAGPIPHFEIVTTWCPGCVARLPEVAV